MTKSTELTKAKGTEVAAPLSYGEFEHEGFEDTTINDLSIPFLNVMQPLSQMVVEGLIEGVKAGDLVNSVTKEILKQPIVLQPVHKEEVWVEWVPRTKGGGLVARHDPNSDVVKQVLAKNNQSRIPPKSADGKRPPFQMPDGSGNDIIETYYVYCLIMDAEGESVDGYCVLSFSSTKIRVQKDWMTAMYTQKGRPPMFANRALLSTVIEKREAGSSFNYSIAPFASTWRESLIVPDEAGMKLLVEAKEFREMILNGLASPDMDGATETESGPASPAASGSKAGSADDAPF